jgi:LysM repeat protein
MEAFLGDRDREENGVTTSSSSSVISETEYFVFHKVSKLDTLAGIAIKYNVQVGEIKLANGLHSDMSLFARDHIKIPKKKLPPSMYYKPESKNSNGNGGHGGLHHSSRSLPLTGGNMSVAMTQLKNFYGLEKEREQLQGRERDNHYSSSNGGVDSLVDLSGGSSSSRDCGIGNGNGNGKANGGSSSSNPNQSFKPSLSHSGIVETIMKKQEESLKTKEVHHKMNGASGKIAEEKGLGLEAAKRADLMRKRNKETADHNGSGIVDISGGSGSSPRSTSKSKSPGFTAHAYPSRAPLFDSVSSTSASSKSSGAMGQSSAPTQKKESLFQKIKKAANKPALAPSMSRSVKLTDVGDATLKGLRSAKSETSGMLSASKLASKAD